MSNISALFTALHDTDTCRRHHNQMYSIVQKELNSLAIARSLKIIFHFPYTQLCTTLC